MEAKGRRRVVSCARARARAREKLQLSVTPPAYGDDLIPPADPSLSAVKASSGERELLPIGTLLDPYLAVANATRHPALLS